ncbi:MAG: alpha/beta fold hydrolase [Gemmatimonadaceae bacterium]|jgi:triacylglycerol lipase|nr:alpha/beta fold hydrolase [Gemmatimonadaceae bacterium]
MASRDAKRNTTQARRIVRRPATAAAVGIVAHAGGSPLTAERSMSLPVGADTLACIRMGSGPALVIIHGVGGHKEDWRGVATALAAMRTVYAIDMLGFGESSRDAADMGMAAQAAAVIALLDHEGIATADLLGNSVGGWVAATVAATTPERVARLIVADVAGFAAMFAGDPPANLFPDSVDEMARLLTFVRASPAAHTPEAAAAAFAAFEASGERTIVPRLFPALFGSPKLEEVMPRITAPTLVLWGNEDRFFPVALAPYITGLVPGATSTIIAGASHFPQLDNEADVVAAVRDFLT